MLNKHLHVFSDEKWTNSVVRQFLDSGESNQQFVILVNDSFKQPKYKLNPDLPLQKLECGSNEYKSLISDLDSYSTIFIHYLCDIKLDLIESAGNASKLVWMCWGQDIHKMIIPNSYMPLTRKLLWKNGFKQEYFWKYTLWLRQLKYPYTKRGQVLKKIDYCCPVIYSDLQETNKQLNLNIKFLPFHYSTLEQLLGDFINCQSNGTNILIGNSSSYASNHLDVFDILQKIDLYDKKVIVPLNYGDVDYGDNIEKYGKSIFGSNFLSLRQFLDNDEYTAIIQSCSIAIFNHIRQQALGNILICLWMGIKVYLNEEGFLFKYIKDLQLPVWSIQSDLVLDNSEVFNRLDEKEHARSKVILLKEFGQENTNRLIVNLFEELNDK